MFNFKPKNSASDESNMSRLVRLFDEELRDSLTRGGIFASDEEAAKEATLGLIVTRITLLGNALVDVAACFGVTLTPADETHNGGYPYGFQEAHEQAQFIMGDVFRQGYPPQLWSTDMIKMLVAHIASRMAKLQEEGDGLRGKIHELEVSNATLRARLDGFVGPARPTQHPTALPQLVHASDPRAKLPEAPPPPAPRKDEKVTDFFVIERQAGKSFRYYTPRGKWSSDPLDGMRFLSEVEAQRYLRTRVKPKEKSAPFSLRGYATPRWQDLQEFFS